jgi:hypothetical protein
VIVAREFQRRRERRARFFERGNLQRTAAGHHPIRRCGGRVPRFRVVPCERVRVLVELPRVTLLDRDREPFVDVGALDRHDAGFDRLAHQRMPEHQPPFLLCEQPCDHRRNQELRDLVLRQSARIGQHAGIDRSNRK